MPQHVLDALAAAPVREVTVVGRRGPAQAAFTTQELRELNTLAGATVLVDPADMTHDAAEEHGDRAIARNLAELRGWVGHEPRPGTIPLRLQFHRRPVRLLGDERVTGIALERTVVDDEGVATGTGEISVLLADLVVRSVGYRGHPLPGLPVDERTGTVDHVGGRVLRDEQSSPGEYVAGWIKRGPTGVVGTNKHDAHETVASLLADVDGGSCRSKAPSTTSWTRSSREDCNPYCSTTGRRSTQRRPRWVPVADVAGPRCTNESSCSKRRWPRLSSRTRSRPGCDPRRTTRPA